MSQGRLGLDIEVRHRKKRLAIPKAIIKSQQEKQNYFKNLNENTLWKTYYRIGLGQIQRHQNVLELIMWLSNFK